MQTLTEVKEKLKAFNYEGFSFNEEKHLYTLDDEILPSGSGLPKRFCKPVDWEDKAQKSADKKGITKAEIKAIWKANNEAACILGTNIHKFIENFLSGVPDNVSNYSEVEQKMIQSFLVFYRTRMYKVMPVAQELRMFSRKMKMAGTLDNLSWLPDNPNNIEYGKLLQLDYKSNEKLTSDKDCAYNFMTNVFYNCYENKFNEYSIQLTAYELMLAEVGIKLDGSYIIYIPREGDCELMKINDYKPQLIKYFNLEDKI